jgi:hypothetical protein
MKEWNQREILPVDFFGETRGFTKTGKGFRFFLTKSIHGYFWSKKIGVKMEV